MRSKLGTAILAALGMMILILDGKTAIQGAADGIGLCIRSVIPSLFPFFVLSSILTSSLWGAGWLRWIAGIIGMPDGSGPLLITGLLGGYPVGAQNVALACHKGQLSKGQAQYLLGFCNNAGPSFIFGIVAGQFSQWWAGPAIWGIHILSAILTGCLLSCPDCEKAALTEREPVTLPASLNQSIRAIAAVCSWIILMRIVIAYLDSWVLHRFDGDIYVWLIGLLELANGCCSLDAIADPQLRFVTASVLLALGGVCISMQTRSVTVGLSLKTYSLGKLIQAVFSLIFSSALIMRLYWIIPVSIAAVILIKFRKNVWKFENSWYIIRKNGL